MFGVTFPCGPVVHVLELRGRIFSKGGIVFDRALLGGSLRFAAGAPHAAERISFLSNKATGIEQLPLTRSYPTL